MPVRTKWKAFKGRIHGNTRAVKLNYEVWLKSSSTW